jgi:hypothetical protein
LKLTPQLSGQKRVQKRAFCGSGVILIRRERVNLTVFSANGYSYIDPDYTYTDPKTGVSEIVISE